MKKKLVMMLVAAIPFISYAQSRTEITTLDERTGWRNYVTNRFGDNWFISVGAGGQVLFSPADQHEDFGKRIAPSFDFSIGKWIVPTIGIRAQASGFRLKGLTTADNMYATSTRRDNGWYKQSWQQFNVHADVLINLSNWIGGYRQDRFYEFVPFLGFGVMHAMRAQDNNTFIADAGILNKMRLSDVFDFNIEIRGNLFPKKFSGEPTDKKVNGILSVTAGFTANLSNKRFKRVEEVILAEQLALALANQRLGEAESQLAREQARNRQLQEELERERAREKQIVEREYVSAPRAIFFTINRANITARDKINLRFLSDEIKQSSGKVYTITGYADKATGSPEYNMQLSRKRAENVYEVLTKEFGVNPSQLKVEWRGGVTTSELFDSNPLNRVSIIARDR